MDRSVSERANLLETAKLGRMKEEHAKDGFLVEGVQSIFVKDAQPSNTLEIFNQRSCNRLNFNGDQISRLADWH